MKKEARDVAGVESSGRSAAAGITDMAVRKATGKGWGDWYDLLDSAGAREMSHQQIRAIVAGQGTGSWWHQVIAVAYEQARSLRDRYQREDGFVAHISKVIRAGVTRVYGAWTEEEIRAGWLDASGWHLRKATPCRSLRITWKDGRTHVDIDLFPRSLGKTWVRVEHSRLATLDDAHRLKAFWGVALERLRELLETAKEPHSFAA